ncbi:MAG TPA: NADPH:quinone oxidoreductase family protein [Bacillota bacterium]|nr:NADPH:quinone oxidoreductase family protein [Bacillota bacterium]
MKAVVVSQLGGPEGLKYVEMEKPVPTQHQVLIRVEATSVNFADIKVRYGNYHGAGQPPFIPGLDVAGTVEAVGENVHRIKVGQRVIAFPKAGSYAEYVVADEILTYSISDSLDWDTAAACPIVSFTSYKLLADVARLEKGETVLVHAAAGGVGTTAIQLAKLLGSGTVIGTVGDLAKAEAALEAGADYVISYDGFAQSVHEITKGHGVDVVLDSIGGTVSEQSLTCLAMYGRIANFGNASGSAGMISTLDLHSSCRSILGFSLGTTRSKRPQLLQSVADHVFPYLESGQLKMKIGHRFKLSEAAEAHACMERRQHTGKIILTVR